MSKLDNLYGLFLFFIEFLLGPSVSVQPTLMTICVLELKSDISLFCFLIASITKQVSIRFKIKKTRENYGCVWA